jgi:hypothetical protein
MPGCVATVDPHANQRGWSPNWLEEAVTLRIGPQDCLALWSVGPAISRSPCDACTFRNRMVTEAPSASRRGAYDSRADPDAEFIVMGFTTNRMRAMQVAMASRLAKFSLEVHSEKRVSSASRDSPAGVARSTSEHDRDWISFGADLGKPPP